MSTIKTLKSFFYQKPMRMLSLRYFEKKKIAEEAKLKKAEKEKEREKGKEDDAFVIAKASLEILNKNKWKKRDDTKEDEKTRRGYEKIHGENLKKLELHMNKKNEAQRKIEQSEEKIRFWSVMIEMKEKMEVMRRQREMHRIKEPAMKKEETRIATDMAQAM